MATHLTRAACTVRAGSCDATVTEKLNDGVRDVIVESVPGPAVITISGVGGARNTAATAAQTDSFSMTMFSPE